VEGRLKNRDPHKHWRNFVINPKVKIPKVDFDYRDKNREIEISLNLSGPGHRMDNRY